MQSAERDLRILLGAFLRRRAGSAKDLARIIGCDPRSAENYRAGRYWPQAKHWLGIVQAFGRDVTDAVFHPEEAAARLAMEIRDLEDHLAKKRAALADSESAAARLVEIEAACARRSDRMKRSG